VLRFLETTGVGKSVPKERPTEDHSDASIVDYASELEEEAEAQQARRLAQMETELGVLLWTCPDGVYMRAVPWGAPGWRVGGGA